MPQSDRHGVLLTEYGTKRLDEAGLQLETLFDQHLSRDVVVAMLLRIGAEVARSLVSDGGFYTTTSDVLRDFLLSKEDTDPS